MTREEQLRFCKVCKNQKFDIKQGIVCSLTSLPADFETSCDSFHEDAALKTQYDLKSKESELLRNTASLGKRFANHVLDGIFFLILSLVFGFLLGIVLLIVFPDALFMFEDDNPLLDYFWGFVFGMVYYTVFEALTGRTIAKYITRTKVVTENGEKPDLGTIFIRSLCRFVPFNALSFFGSDNSGWHDLWSKTRVIDC